jgi:hypothetical protein
VNGDGPGGIFSETVERDVTEVKAAEKNQDAKNEA